MGPGQQRVPAQPAEGVRRGRQHRLVHPGAAHGHPVAGPGGRRLSGAARQGHRRSDHHLVDPDLPRPGAGRAGDRQLARIRRRPAELDASVAAPGRQSAGRRADPPAPARAKPLGRRHQRGAAGGPTAGDPGHRLQSEGRRRPGHHRRQRLRQVLPGAGPGGCLAAGAGQGAAGRRRAGPMGRRTAGPASRLPAAGRGADGRLHRPEHLPVRSRRRPRGGVRRRTAGGHARDDQAFARWL